MTAKELNICMIAHRGYSGKYFMNTALAFEKAAENKSGGAETDIRMTSDGVLVCSHNREAVLNDGTELIVSESTFTELTALPLKNDKTDDDVYLCTFRRYLEIMKQNDMICFIELKDEFSDSQVQAVIDEIRKTYSLSKCILQSFDFENLLRLKRIVPELPLMLTYGSKEKNYERCFDHGISLDICFDILTQKIIDEFHAHSLEVAVWTANTREDFEYCKSFNVDYIESDYFGGND